MWPKSPARRRGGTFTVLPDSWKLALSTYRLALYFLRQAWKLEKQTFAISNVALIGNVVGLCAGDAYLALATTECDRGKGAVQ
jgi:hypothetical protein